MSKNTDVVVPYNERKSVCEMCQFLFIGHKNAHSKQAKAEYGEGFLIHFTRFHSEVFGEK